jgi:hypothetical protein
MAPDLHFIIRRFHGLANISLLCNVFSLFFPVLFRFNICTSLHECPELLDGTELIHRIQRIHPLWRVVKAFHTLGLKCLGG